MTRKAERRRVIVTGDLDAIVDTDACGLPFGVFIAALRQRTERRAIHLDEGAVAAAGHTIFHGL